MWVLDNSMELFILLGMELQLCKKMFIGFRDEYWRMQEWNDIPAGMCFKILHKKEKEKNLWYQSAKRLMILWGDGYMEVHILLW